MIRQSPTGYNLLRLGAFGHVRRRLPGGLPEAARPLLDEALFGKTRTGYTPRWPAFLPPPLLAGAGNKRQASFTRTDMEAGQPRSRRRSTAQMVQLPLKWRFSPLEYDVFEAFHHLHLFDGAGWFYIALDTPRGWRDVTARFTAAFDTSLLPGLNKEVSATLEVRDWPTMPAAELMGYL